MAKIVIAGKADCPYYAKCELLGDFLKRNLPSFQIHKIVLQPTEWEKWLKKTCIQRGWSHTKSPIVWRELVDRGGKGSIIGGPNDFQEYIRGYYDMKSSLSSNDMTLIAGENLETKRLVDEEEAAFRALSKPVKITITNASNPISYHMVETLAQGQCLGPNTELSVSLFDYQENFEVMEGLQMELFDLACPLVRNISVTSNLSQAFCDSVAVVILDEVVQKDDESREEWLLRNSEFFQRYMKHISEFAHPDVKIILAGDGPINFNALMMSQVSEKIPKQNIVTMSRVVERRAKAVIGEKLKVNSACVVDVIVWGNQNGQHFIDVNRGRVHEYDGAVWGPAWFSLPVPEMVADEKWLQTEFLQALESRRKSEEEALRHSTSLSYGTSLASLLQHWCLGSPQGQMFSLGVYSDGQLYDVPEGLFFSLPVRFTETGYWEAVDDIVLTEAQKSELTKAVQDLMSEKYATFPELKPVSPAPEQSASQTGEGEGDAQAGSLQRIAEDPQGEEREEEEAAQEAAAAGDAAAPADETAAAVGAETAAAAGAETAAAAEPAAAETEAGAADAAAVEPPAEEEPAAAE